MNESDPNPESRIANRVAPREALAHAEAAALAMIERGYASKAAENFLREVKDNEDLAEACVLLVEPYLREIISSPVPDILAANIKTAIENFAAKGQEILERQS